MTELNITTLLKNQRRYEAELLILRDCSDIICETEGSDDIVRYALLKRRLALIKHWLHLLPLDECQLVQKHLIEQQSWKTIAEQAVCDPTHDIVCDARTLQRMQARALQRLERFTQRSFGNTLDFLIDSEEDTTTT